MSELTITSIKTNIIEGNAVRLQPLTTWFHFLNFATLATVCLIFLKLYKGFMLLYKWMFPFKHVMKNPTILVIGPKKDVVEKIVNQLSLEFDGDIVDLNENTPQVSPHEYKAKRSMLLYSHASVNSQNKINELSSNIQKTYGFVDVLVIVQNEDLTQANETFLTHLNKELLRQFWTVMAFLPGMLRRNNGHIISIALGKSSLVNTGIMRTIYEDLLQVNTNVTLTLVERNTFLENFLPTLPNDVMAKIIIKSMWKSNSIVKVPSISCCLFILPIFLMKAVIKPVLKVANFNLA